MGKNEGNEYEKGREGGKGLSFNMENFILGDRGNWFKPNE